MEYGAAIQALVQAGFQYATRYVVQSTNNGTPRRAGIRTAGMAQPGGTVRISLSVSR